MISFFLVIYVLHLFAFNVQINCQRNRCSARSECLPTSWCPTSRQEFPGNRCYNSPYRGSRTCCLRNRVIPITLPPVNRPRPPVNRPLPPVNRPLPPVNRPRPPVVGPRPPTSVSRRCSPESTCLPTRWCPPDRRTSPSQRCYSALYRRTDSICCLNERSPRNMELNIVTRPTPRPPQLPPAGNECGRSQMDNTQSPFVMDGQDSSPGEWPWMAVILIRESDGRIEPVCSGFLVSRIHIISAAHCFLDRNASLYSVRLGDINSARGDEYTVQRIAIPEGYRSSLHYDDIAMMTLSRQVNTPNVMPICLPDEGLPPGDLSGLGSTVAGWGATRPMGNMSPTLKHLSNMPIIENSLCDSTMRRLLSAGFAGQFPTGISSGILCAGFLDEAGRDSCGGDSGGPLMVRNTNNVWYAVGVVSFGYECGVQGFPGGYVRITNYMDWIRENMN